MSTFAARHASKVAAGVCLLVVADPDAARSQSELERIGDRELEITGVIEEVESQFGPQARELIEPLTALSLLYEESGLHVLGDTSIERLLSVIRANLGLYSLEQAPSIRLLMSHELERGNTSAAWDLERELLRLGLRSPDDVRTARIFTDIGDRRIDILQRYETGELPDEIELGCYYNDSNEYLRAARRGAQSLHTAPGQQTGNSCAAGRRGIAKRALASEADTFYNAAIEVYQRNDLETTDEFRELLTRVVQSSYDHDSPGFAQRNLIRLMESYPEDSRDPLPRIETLIQLGDWYLFYSSIFGTRYRVAALATYQDAYAQLVEHGIAQSTIDALFSPDLPIMLPSFRPNPLVSTETPGSAGHIDVAFIVTSEGEGDEIEILDTSTEDLTRKLKKDLEHTIERGQFRPIIVDGTVIDSAPFMLRYYLD